MQCIPPTHETFQQQAMSKRTRVRKQTSLETAAYDMNEQDARGSGSAPSLGSSVAAAGQLRPAGLSSDEDAPKEVAAAAIRRSSRHKKHVDYNCAVDECDDEEPKPKKDARIGHWQAMQVYCLEWSDLAQLKDTKITPPKSFLVSVPKCMDKTATRPSGIL